MIYFLGLVISFLVLTSTAILATIDIPNGVNQSSLKQFLNNGNNTDIGNPYTTESANSNIQTTIPASSTSFSSSQEPDSYYTQLYSPISESRTKSDYQTSNTSKDKNSFYSSVITQQTKNQAPNTNHNFTDIVNITQKNLQSSQNK
ncbi:hypothetical protein CL657_01665 [bacterium]|nr:hypothetical protein [bacterium]|tara:strand:- start:479 stop:916 length:438 start_codon:yes stop_codon:yes gene_type:complete